MSDEMINPFKQKKVDWAAKSREKLISKKEDITQTPNKNTIQKTGKLSKPKARVAKSFKVYKGKLSRDFDKRVNRMQVHFDDLDFDKNYVDSGKYIMFLMAFAEKYGLYDLYRTVDGDGKIEVSKQDILNHFGKIL